MNVDRFAPGEGGRTLPPRDSARASGSEQRKAGFRAARSRCREQPLALCFQTSPFKALTFSKWQIGEHRKGFFFSFFSFRQQTTAGIDMHRHFSRPWGLPALPRTRAHAHTHTPCLLRCAHSLTPLVCSAVHMHALTTRACSTVHTHTHTPTACSAVHTYALAPRAHSAVHTHALAPRFLYSFSGESPRPVLKQFPQWRSLISGRKHPPMAVSRLSPQLV